MLLNQVIAIVEGRKTKVQQEMTAIHHGWKGPGLAGGIKTYTPLNEADTDLAPREEQKIQVYPKAIIAKTKAMLGDFWNLIATQETANTTAKADIIVDGAIVLPQVPVTVLLFLQKQLTDLRTLVDGIPTLPPDKSWSWDGNRGCYITPTYEQMRTKKMQVPLVLYQATEQHPAQTQMITEDRVVGRYQTTMFSSAIPADEKAGLLEKIDKLRDATKVAREQANSVKVDEVAIAAPVLNFIFG